MQRTIAKLAVYRTAGSGAQAVEIAGHGCNTHSPAGGFYGSLWLGQRRRGAAFSGRLWYTFRMEEYRRAEIRIIFGKYSNPGPRPGSILAESRLLGDVKSSTQNGPFTTLIANVPVRRLKYPHRCSICFRTRYKG